MSAHVLYFMGKIARPDSLAQIAELGLTRFNYARVARKVAQATRGGAKAEFLDLVETTGKQLRLSGLFVSEVLWRMLSEHEVSLDSEFRLTRDQKLRVPPIRQRDPAFLFSML